tara:strand:+ start:1132 stop:1446 length:315 start_codon:yes stop_codon:yes gene_type:complete
LDIIKSVIAVITNTTGYENNVLSFPVPKGFILPSSLNIISGFFFHKVQAIIVYIAIINIIGLLNKLNILVDLDPPNLELKLIFDCGGKLMFDCGGKLLGIFIFY